MKNFFLGLKRKKCRTIQIIMSKCPTELSVPHKIRLCISIIAGHQDHVYKNN